MTATVLKTCNCCLSSRAQVRQMTPRKRIAWCYSCKSNTAWTQMSDEEATSYETKRAERAAFIESLAQ